MRRAVVYRRVSKATETNLGGSLDDQLHVCTRRVETEGCSLTQDYCEEGRSAYDERPNRRPVFQQLLADAKAGKFDLVVVYKYDRFSRRMLPGLQARAELREAGVGVISATEPFDEDTAAGRYSVRNMMNMSELFSDMLSERMTTRRQAEAASGRHLGPAPIGYRHAGRGALEIEPPYDQFVRAALELVATGQYSRMQIAATLTDQGYTLGRPIGADDIRRVTLAAPIYAGRVRSGEMWIPGIHPPLISDDLCARVLEMALRRGKKKNRYVRTKDPVLLAGMLYCDVCRQAGHDTKLHYHSDHRKDPPWRAFRCPQTNRVGGCTSPYALADPLEAQALTLIDALALPPDWIDEALGLLEMPAPRRPQIDRTKIEEKIRRLDRLYEAGAKSDHEWQTERRALRAQLEEALTLPPLRISPREIAHYLTDLPTLVRRGTTAEQRAVLGEIFDQFYVERDRLAAVRPTMLYAPLIEAVSSVLGDRY